MDKTDITESSESYNRLKEDIKEKYTKMMCAELDSVRRYVIDKSSSFLGEDFLAKLEEVDRIKQECDKIRKEFRSRDDYKAAQKELSEASKQAKGIADSDDNSDREEIKRLNKAIGAITTLNVTLNNKLKERNEREAQLNSELDKIVRDNESDFKEINNEVVTRVKKAISDCLGGYADEMKDLNSSFGIENDDFEMPFDEKVIRLDIPVFSKSPFKRSDDDDGETFIHSDDDNGILN